MRNKRISQVPSVDLIGLYGIQEPPEDGERATVRKARTDAELRDTSRVICKAFANRAEL